MTPTQIGRYKIERMLGRGGMSSVYLAEDPVMARLVAIKILPPEFLHHPSFRERFDREARIIAALEHPAILPIYDYGEADGLPYFIMRHMQGGSLTDRLANGALSLDETTTIVERIGSALDYAHSQGVIHRDLKPGNILFDQWGSAYLGDFGIARLEEAGATLTGSLHVGTPAYMSPEQVEGKPGIDGRADIYALGIIVFESLTGSRPYHAETPSSLALKHILEPVPRILETDETLPPETDNVIYKAMAKKPDDRYATAAALTSDLARLAKKQPVAAPSPPEKAAAGTKTGTVVARPTRAVRQAALAQPSTTPGKTSPSQQRKPERRFPLWLWLSGAGLLVLCLGAVSVSLILASNGGLGGLFGKGATQTATPSIVSTAAATNTTSPTREPSRTPRSSPTSTASMTPTQIQQQATPSLIPTFTATAAAGAGSALPTPTWTSVPTESSPAQPTSPPQPQPTSPPQSQPTATPQPTSPPAPTRTPTKAPPATATPTKAGPPPTSTPPPPPPTAASTSTQAPPTPPG